MVTWTLILMGTAAVVAIFVIRFVLGTVLRLMRSGFIIVISIVFVLLVAAVMHFTKL